MAGSVTVTVGAGKDFETLHEALRWVEGVNCTVGGVITLSLDDGTHILGGQGEFNTDSWNYYTLSGVTLHIVSASGTKANCIITIDGYDDGDNWPTLIFMKNCSVTFQQVTYDGNADTYPYPENVSVVVGQNSYVSIWGSTIKNASDVTLTSGQGLISTSVFDNLKVGVQSLSAAYIEIGTDSTVQNCAVGCRALYGGRIVGVPTFVTNTANTNITLNQIQYNGSYITSGTVALSFKP